MTTEQWSAVLVPQLAGSKARQRNPASGGFNISKADVMWLYNSYDNEDKLAQIFLDCTIYIPT